MDKSGQCLSLNAIASLHKQEEEKDATHREDRTKDEILQHLSHRNA